MSERRSVKRLPRFVDPRKLAHLNARYDGNVPIDEALRLADAVDALHSVYGDLTFFVDEFRKKRMQGDLEVQVDVICQRCLESMPYKVCTSVDLAVVWDEDEAKRLPRSLDPWITEEGDADLYEILEEEVLLNLPHALYHEHLCVDARAMSVGSNIETGQALGDAFEKPNPFKALEGLKNTFSKNLSDK